MDQEQKQKIEIIIKDYEILKTYSTITSPGIRNNIISFALATLGIIFSGILFAMASNEPSNALKLTIILLMVLFIPAFCLTILFIWLGKEERMIRIGRYLIELENKINNELKDQILVWEKFIRKKEESIYYPEILIIGLFLGISLGFSTYGAYLINFFFNLSTIISYLVNYLLLLIILILHLLLFIYIYFFIYKKGLKK